MRAIDADEFAKRLMELWDKAEAEGRNDIVSVLANYVTPCLVGTPTIDPVKHGKWIKDMERDMLRCSVCKNFCVENWYYWLRYCPDCGARMDGE